MTTLSHKTSPACLSHMRLGRLASGDMHASSADTEHLAGCEACSTILARQQEDVQAMGAGRVPAELLMASAGPAQRNSGMRLGWPAWATLAATVCAAVLVIPHLRREPRLTHIKGVPSLAVSLTRDDALILDEMPIEKVQSVHVGDRLRVRVINAQEQQVQLDMCSQEGPCDNLFSGALPQDAWIPAGLKIATPTPTVLRLRVCPPGTPLQQCEPHDFTLLGP